tara:strand:- start:1719 stop:2417 length:699 start_codon:yes stop_codon:yes gene_type:complete
MLTQQNLQIHADLNAFAYVLMLFISLLIPNLSYGFAMPEAALIKIKQQHGIQAVSNIKAWETLINKHRHESDLKKLRLVTDFFNKYKRISDQKLWNKTNYWATPVELLERGAGDCEDYVIAKYFTLKTMGVSIDKLRLVYATSHKLKQPHMVLAYYETPGSDPFILDNLTNWISYGSERPDLIPIYTFNGENVWFSLKKKGKKVVSSTKSVYLWQDLLNKMRKEQIPEEMIQ